MIDGHFIECDPTYDGPYLRLIHSKSIVLCFEFENNRDSMPLLLKDHFYNHLRIKENINFYHGFHYILYCEFSLVGIDLIASIQTILKMNSPNVNRKENKKNKHMEQKQRDLEKEHNRVENIKAMYKNLHENNNYNHHYYANNNLGTFQQNFPMLGNGIDTIGTETDSSKDGSPEEDKSKQVEKGFASIVSKGAANGNSAERNKRQAKTINVVPLQGKNTNNGAVEMAKIINRNRRQTPPRRAKLKKHC